MARFGARRRRRRTGQWFPVLGQETEAGEGSENDIAAQHFTMAVGGNTPSVTVLGLTWDFPTEEQIVLGQGLPSLADWQGSAWFLEKVVGHLFISHAGEAVPETKALYVVAALIVLRVDESDGSPLATGTAFANQYDPALMQNIRDPFIWRRSWILGQNLKSVNNNAGTVMDDMTNAAGWPSNNVAYASSMDNHHIDTKSKRAIKDEERLFLALSARHYPWTVDATGLNSVLDCAFDYRIVGRLIKATNKRNASR